MNTQHTIRVPANRPHCRTPIKPRQAHRIHTRYTRKPKHPNRSQD